MRLKPGKMLETCKSFADEWDMVLNIWSEKMKILLYSLIVKYEEDAEFLEKKLNLDRNQIMRSIQRIKGLAKEKIDNNEKMFDALAVPSEPEKRILETKVLSYICRNSPVTVKTILNKYALSKGWLTLNVRKWKKEKLIQVKNKPLMLVKTKNLTKKLKSYLKPNLTDVYEFTKGRELVGLASETIDFINRLDEIVRNEGK
ncbi:hypothetical protein ES705_39920 [subsurface metagenome]